MNNWTTVRLGEVLALDLERVSIDAGTSYPMVGVFSFGRGLFDREPIENGKTSYKYFYRLKPEHVVMSQLFGWEGALALSNDQFSGKFLSPQFPTFLCDPEKLDRQFLGRLMQRKVFWDDLGSRTSGMGDRRRTLTPDALFASEIPLPPLNEQQRIVAQIQELATRIQEAKTFHYQVKAEIEALVISVHIQLSGSRVRNISQFLMLDEDKVAISPTEEYPQVGVRSFAGGLFPKAAICGTGTTYRTYNRLYDGAIVLSQVKGWEGAIAVCTSDLAGWFVSPEYRTFRCITGEASSDYLASLFRTEWFWGRLKSATRGVGARRERTRPEQFMTIEIPIPDMEGQKIGEHLFAQISKLNLLQSETATELDALLPAILDRAFKGELL